MESFNSLDLVYENLFSPMVLAFFLGLLAVRLKSDLKLPDGAYAMLSYYLLLALGLKGGSHLRDSSLEAVFLPIFSVLILGCVFPVIAFFIAKLGKFSKIDSAALAAHYGSVSVVTFMAALIFVEKAGAPADGFMTALVTILEVPGIVVALLLGQNNRDKQQVVRESMWSRVYAILVSKSILLLLGGLVIGFINGPKGITPIAPFFVDPFKGILVLFLLDMGILAGQRLEALTHLPRFILFYGVFVPLIHAVIAIVTSQLIGLSLGSTTTLAVMAASASYIAAPAAIRLVLPEANPGIYLTSAIVITFPFNLTIGIPLYYSLTQWWFAFCK